MIAAGPSTPDLVLCGEVRSEAGLPALRAESSLVGLGRVIAITLADIPLPATWRLSRRATASDHLSLFENGKWRRYYHDGRHWRSPGSNASYDSTSVPPDAAILVRPASL